MGRKFLLKIDNMILKYLSDQPNLNARKARWLDFLSEYHFELKHIKGKENKFADALSQRTHIIYEVTLSQTDVDLHENIRTAIKVDPFYVKSSRRSKRIGCFNDRRNTKCIRGNLNLKWAFQN